MADIQSATAENRRRRKEETRNTWANAQRDGRPAKYRWLPLFNAAVWLTPTTRVPCSKAAKTRNPLKLRGVPQTNERISAASEPKFTIQLLVQNTSFRENTDSCTFTVMSSSVKQCDYYILCESRNVLWSRASVCLSVCLSADACPNYCTDTDVTW